MAESFGRYQLLKKIAAGGMAEIYLARQQGLEGFEKLLVLKRILPHLAQNDEFVEMFLHEARVAVRLNHPNIVQIYDLGEADGSYFIAMEYIHGDDARRVWKQADGKGTPIPVPLVCRIITDAASGLDYAHKKADQTGRALNIIHRDVSPQNILISFEGAVKVVDFGIAKAADQATVTRSGVLKGKYSYMSPEQAAGKDIDQRTDQFALGIVLYELLTCMRLFKRQSDVQTLAAVSECKVLPPSEVNPRVPKSLDAIVMRALQHDADRRYPDLRGLQLALDEWIVANRQAASTSNLSSFLVTVYEERLAREKAEGLSADEVSDSSSSRANDRGLPRRTGSVRAERPRGTGVTKAGRKPEGSLQEVAPDVRGAERADGTAAGLLSATVPTGKSGKTPLDVPDDGTVTGSSVSRLVDRLSSRKKATLGVAAVAVVAGVTAALFSMQQGNSAIQPKPTHPGVVADEGLHPIPPAAVRFGGLKILSVPAGATVSVDTRRIEGVTPLTVSELSLGEHSVYLELAGHADEQRVVRLERDREIVPLRVELKPDAVPLMAKLTIESEPAGAEAFVDGVSSGKTPVTLELAGHRTVEVEAQKPGHLPAKRTVDLSQGPARVLLTLARKAAAAPAAPAMATVSITSEPSAMVWEGTVKLGETPLTARLAAGRHRLTLANPQQGLDYSVNLQLKPEETLTRDFKFEPGEVQIVVAPPGVGADIYLRNRKIGQNPMPRFPILEGEHTFTLVNEELKQTKRVKVNVEKGKLAKVTVDFGE